ncbi:MAG: hypothetical protein HQ464_10980, partial [Planctomycetes bacterium]|nr:hypothetical protein [Planctomycetota bacterium]
VNGQQLGTTISSAIAYANNGGTSEPTVGLGSVDGTTYNVRGSMADVRFVVQGYGAAFGASNGMTGFTDGAITAANMQTLYGIKPIDPASVTTTASGSTITAGGTFSIANAAASGGKIRDDATITALPTLSGADANRFNVSGITANQTIAPGASATGTVSFTDAANLLNGAVTTASLSGLTVARATMPGLSINSTTFTTSSTLSYTVASPTITGNTATLGLAQTANATDLTGLFSETARGVANALGTRATLLSGTADNGTAVSQTWRLRTGTGPETANVVVSDVVDLTTPTAANPFVLQMNYDPADLPDGATENSLFLGWADPNQGGTFVNAGFGNSDAGAFSQFVAGAWNPSFATPGYFGLDTQANTVWAVIDHNSDFAVVVVPEPHGMLWAAAGLAMAVIRLRRRV